MTVTTVDPAAGTTEMGRQYGRAGTSISTCEAEGKVAACERSDVLRGSAFPFPLGEAHANAVESMVSH